MSKLKLHDADKLLKLAKGETLPFSSFKGELAQELISENIISVSGKGKKTLTINSLDSLQKYLQVQFGIADLETYIINLQSAESLTRSDLVKVSGNSKVLKIRTFTGFLVNTINPITAVLNEKKIEIDPPDGAFMFISDYQHFTIDENVVIIGVENSENFKYIRRQKSLFNFEKCLFVSRYPQNQSKDLINWLSSVKNLYYHFGDFDFAGLNIFVNEYQKHLGGRAKLFTPPNLEHYFNLYGNRQLFLNQQVNFELSTQSEQVKKVISLIEKYQKGLEQEVFIGEE